MPLLTVSWDSGTGFNSYEQRVFQPLIPAVEDGDKQISITLGATGRRYPASQSKDVVCADLFIDGHKIDLISIAGKPILNKRGLRFKNTEKLTFTIKASSHVGIRFRTDTNSGIAFVAVNGLESETDLYMANEAAKFKQLDYWLLQPDGTFTVQTDLPRYPVRELQITNGEKGKPVQLFTAELRGKGKNIDLLHGQPKLLGELRFKDVVADMKNYVHPLQLVQQICFALLSVWLLIALLRLAAERGGLRKCLLADQRPWFWLILAISLAVFSTWLAAFWPGVMSVDSLKVWRAALLPDVYLNDHPFLNVILYKYLRHLWDAYAIVPMMQVFLTALLISWLSFWIYQQGVPLFLVLCWLLFVLCSVPVGIYNTVLWKDIPFALLVVFWACILIKLRLEKQQHRLHWTGERLCAFLLLGLALGLVRHNGLIYFAVLPLLFLLLGLAPLKKALVGLAILLVLAGAGFAVLRLSGRTAGTGFLSQEIRKYTARLSGQRLSVQNVTKDAKRTMQDYLTVLNINQNHQKWDKFHHYFQDRQAWWFLRLSGWHDVYPYQQEKIRFPELNQAALRIYEKSNQQPWVWLTWNPVWLLGLLPFLTLLFWWCLPNTAVLGAVLLAGALPLVYLRIFNWRYYYFLYFGLLFLPAFVSLDLVSWNKKRQSRKPALSVAG
ncbi:hypothetical protein [Candidatus Electronema sp. PJ]|uniref:hypothetical protein n=1 Tax=Candidatus Electronema sp. PJ TaxID=3401572 RepID=UPI003AA91FC4